jgi:hypothetical protein
MSLGYCKGCDKLVSIEPRELKHPGSDSRDRNWYPVTHAKQEHDRCGGAVLVGEDECNRCGESYARIFARGALSLKPICPGVKKPLS